MSATFGMILFSLFLCLLHFGIIEMFPILLLLLLLLLLVLQLGAFAREYTCDMTSKCVAFHIPR